VQPRLQVRSCRNPACPRHRVCLRPEQEGHLASPQHEFGLDIIAAVGRLRHAEHRSVPEIHAELARRGVPIRARSVGNLPDRSDELLALSCTDAARLRRITAEAGRVILAIDGLQPDVGHEVLRVLRDVPSGEVLLARSLLSSCRDDRAKEAERRGEGGPAGADRRGRLRRPGLDPQRGEGGPRRGTPSALPSPPPARGGPAGLPGGSAHQGRLKKEARGIRPIEREVEGREDDEAEAIRGYCAAVRGALTDDGRPPLDAAGLKLQGRPAEVAASPDRAGAKGGSRRS